MTKRPDGWIQLYGSCYYYFNEPSLDHVTIEAIAHSLAYQCRFNGHTRRFYSVAEHSLWVMREVDRPRSGSTIGVALHWSEEIVRAALLHDAAEAIICDLPRPLRKMGACAEVNDEISRVESLIRERWPGDYDHSAIVQADLALLATERQQLLHPAPREWMPMPEPLDIRLECWPPAEAKSRFLHECRRLGVE